MARSSAGLEITSLCLILATPSTDGPSLLGSGLGAGRPSPPGSPGPVSMTAPFTGTRPLSSAPLLVLTGTLPGSSHSSALLLGPGAPRAPRFHQDRSQPSQFKRQRPRPPREWPPIQLAAATAPPRPGDAGPWVHPITTHRGLRGGIARDFHQGPPARPAALALAGSLDLRTRPHHHRTRVAPAMQRNSP